MNFNKIIVTVISLLAIALYICILWILHSYFYTIHFYDYYGKIDRLYDYLIFFKYTQFLSLFCSTLVTIAICKKYKNQLKLMLNPFRLWSIIFMLPAFALILISIIIYTFYYFFLYFLSAIFAILYFVLIFANTYYILDILIFILVLFMWLYCIRQWNEKMYDGYESELDNDSYKAPETTFQQTRFNWDDFFSK